ncbi:SoxR reducing system RseC family protein [Thermodesulfobacteriota bacterium]
MPQYEGIVKEITGEREAKVEICPEQSGIPGAPGLNVCHCASDGSRVSFKAENRVGALVGDYVLIDREISAILKNTSVLIGIPLLGVFFGLLGSLGYTKIFNAGAIYIPAGLFLGLLAGIALGIYIYRRIAGNSIFFITGIVKEGRTPELEENGNYSCSRIDLKSCEKCSANRADFGS